MKCFHHPGLEAVGICKFCSKGLCGGCAVDLGHGLACRGEHEDEVAALAGIAKDKTGTDSPSGRAGIVLSTIAGGGLVVYGSLVQPGLAALASAIGVAFLAYSAVLYSLSRGMWRRVS